MQIVAQYAPTASTPWVVSYAPVISAVVVMFIGIITIYVAVQQWFTSRAKLRLDLYEKRWKVYDACLTIIRDGKDYDNFDAHIAQFLEASSSAPFLFGDDVDDYMKGLGDLAKAQAMNVDYLRFKATPDDTKWMESALEWERERLVEVKLLFTPYLRIKDRSALGPTFKPSRMRRGRRE